MATQNGQRRRTPWTLQRYVQREVFAGLQEVLSILARNRDAAYYGKTIGPKDKDKVLLRWKLDDGRYEVIFGDLRAETVAAEKLRAVGSELKTTACKAVGSPPVGESPT